MADEWILAIDQGTTNTKALLVDREGCTVYRAAVPLEILQPQPGFVSKIQSHFGGRSCRYRRVHSSCELEGRANRWHRCHEST